MDALAADRPRILQGIIDDEVIGGLDADRFAIACRPRSCVRSLTGSAADFCSSTPTSDICRQNSIAEPSSAGTSSSVLISRLLIPIPCNADIKCSTVRTERPFAVSVVLYPVSVTFSRRAAIAVSSATEKKDSEASRRGMQDHAGLESRVEPLPCRYHRARERALLAPGGSRSWRGPRRSGVNRGAAGHSHAARLALGSTRSIEVSSAG